MLYRLNVFYTIQRFLYKCILYYTYKDPEKTKFRGNISSGIESVMNPTIEKIGIELNKTFESVSGKWVKTSSILKKLNLQLVEQR